MANRYLYLDLNSYFASVEQQKNPLLRGKPIVVVAVQTDSTCALAASYEAKALGIKTGTLLFEAKKLCPNLICVLADHEAYVSYHKAAMAEIEKHVPITAVCSIDEAVCKLMDNEDPILLARRIKEGLRKNLGECLTCSIGIASNRYLAKIASDMQKPDGLTHLTDLSQLYSLHLRDLPGVGANMEKRLLRHGIADMKTLLSLDAMRLRKVWGSVQGERLWHLLRGFDLPTPPTKRASLSQSHVVAPQYRAPKDALLVARRLTLKAAARLRREQLFATRFSLSISTETGDQLECSENTEPACDSFTFLTLLTTLWHRLSPTAKLKKIAISLSQFEPPTPSLFGSSPQVKAQTLSHTLDAIHQRFGKESISIGLTPQTKTCIAFTHIPTEEDFDH